METPPYSDAKHTNDPADLVAGLFDRSDHLNKVIEQRQADADADPLAIDEFTVRREKYVRQLSKLLWTIGLTGELQTRQLGA